MKRRRGRLKSDFLTSVESAARRTVKTLIRSFLFPDILGEEIIAGGRPVVIPLRMMIGERTGDRQLPRG